MLTAGGIYFLLRLPGTSSSLGVAPCLLLAADEAAGINLPLSLSFGLQKLIVADDSSCLRPTVCGITGAWVTCITVPARGRVIEWIGKIK